MDGPSALRFGLPTSVGGLPFEDHSTAVEFVLRTQGSFPTVPRLRDAHSSFVYQVTSFFPGSRVLEPGVIDLSTTDVDSSDVRSVELDQLGGPFASVAETIHQIRNAGPDFYDDLIGVRVGVLGPVTTSLVLRSAGIDPHSALELGVKIASTTALGVVDALREALGDKNVVVVLSESGLIGAMHPTFPLLSSQIHGSLAEVVRAIDSRAYAGPLLIGAHVPGRTDWSTIISAGFSLLSVPVAGNLEGVAADLTWFLDAGGTIVWGAVPVDEPLGATDEILWRRLSATWCSLVGAGVDPFQLRAQSLVSTAAGLSHFALPQLDNVFALLDSLSVRVRRQAAGTRLSLGA